jgi:hypothetical protein
MTGTRQGGVDYKPWRSWLRKPASPSREPWPRNQQALMTFCRSTPLKSEGKACGDWGLSTKSLVT